MGLLMSMRDLFILVLLVLSAALIVAEPAVAEAVSPDDRYVLGPDSQVQPGVPEGKVTEFTLAKSKAFPGFEHKWWLYIPAQYDGKKPIALMVFQDGSSYAARDGSWRVPIVLNNLIARKELPVMAAVFVDPGNYWPLIRDRSNRSVEYDTLSAAYASFLLEEIFPEVRMHVRNHGRSGRSRHCWLQQWWYLRIHCGVATARSISQSAFCQWQFHQYPWRQCLSRACASERKEADSHLSAKR